MEKIQNRETFIEMLNFFFEQEEKDKKNKFLVTSFNKVVISSCLSGKTFNLKDCLDKVFSGLWLISQQKPIFTFARKPVAEFKIRSGTAVGCKVTLRKKNMMNFLEKFIRVYLPSIRDFRGISEDAITKDGINIGISDISSFPDLGIPFLKTKIGCTISISIRKRDRHTFVNKEEILKILRFFNFPILIKQKWQN